MARKSQVSVLGRFQETVKRAGLLPEGAKVLVAVSGGADSVCLFDLLRAVAPGLGLELVGFHMNHGLRPTASRDERFVRGVFEFRLVVVRSDVAAYSRSHGLGIEEAARTLRYRNMERVASKYNCDRIALGHTADDNLETMLLNLARGAGLSGISGIPVRRGPYVRPLIDIEREQIVRYLRARRLSWVEDETNQDPRFRRNLLRLQAVPALKAVNPEAAGNARRAAALLREEDEFMETLATEALSRVARVGKTRASVDCAAFENYNPVLKRRMVRHLLPGLDSDGIAKAVRFLRQGPDQTLLLSRSVRLVRQGRVVRLGIPGKEVQDGR